MGPNIRSSLNRTPADKSPRGFTHHPAAESLARTARPRVSLIHVTSALLADHLTFAILVPVLRLFPFIKLGERHLSCSLVGKDKTVMMPSWESRHQLWVSHFSLKFLGTTLQGQSQDYIEIVDMSNKDDLVIEGMLCFKILPVLSS